MKISYLTFIYANSVFNNQAVIENTITISYKHFCTKECSLDSLLNYERYFSQFFHCLNISHIE